MENGQQQTINSLAPARSSSVDAAIASNAHVDNPIMYENGQHLLERDPQLPGCCISKAAEEAQRAKWRQLMANRPPLERIPREMVPTKGSKPPLYRHGILFTMDYMFAYAQRHHLTLEVSPKDRQHWGGREALDFADINVNDFLDCSFALRECARTLSLLHISKRCGLALDIGRPFSSEYGGILSIWSNYDMKMRYRRYVGTPERFDNIITALHEAMNEDCEMGGMGELRWWYDWDNNVNIFTTLE